jgi:hypothetical protein
LWYPTMRSGDEDPRAPLDQGRVKRNELYNEAPIHCKNQPSGANRAKQRHCKAIYRKQRFLHIKSAVIPIKQGVSSYEYNSARISNQATSY